MNPLYKNRDAIGRRKQAFDVTLSSNRHIVSSGGGGGGGGGGGDE
jgi:hypothetical protein